MTEQEATDIVTMMKAASARPVETDSLEYFIARLTTMDYQPALEAATIGAGLWRYFPSWADFMELYRAQKRVAEPVGEQRDQTPLRPSPGPLSKEVPLYVKRWIAARFLYYRFNREQDFRPFREHEQYVDQTDGPVEEWMPDGEWLTESERVSDKEVWGILTVPKPGDWTF